MGVMPLRGRPTTLERYLGSSMQIARTGLLKSQHQVILLAQ
jgi:hypothetical protein